MNCINKKSKEFKDLLEDTGVPSFELERIIMLHQSNTGEDSFPGLDFIKAYTSKAIRSDLNTIERATNEQFSILEETNLGTVFIATIDENKMVSVTIEQEIRQSIITEADKLGVEVQFINNRNVTTKIDFINGKFVVNLSAINKHDSLDSLLAPFEIIKTNPNINFNSGFDSTKETVKFTKIEVSDNKGLISTEELIDLAGKTALYNSSTGESVIYEDSIEADQILNDTSLTHDEIVDKLFNEGRAVKIVDFNFNKAHENYTEKSILFESDVIERELSDAEITLFHITKEISRIQKGLSQESEVKSIYDAYIKDKPAFSEKHKGEESEVTLYPLGPFSFKTEVERKNKIDRIENRHPGFKEAYQKGDNTEVRRILREENKVAIMEFKSRNSAVPNLGHKKYGLSEMGNIFSKIRMNVNRLANGDPKRSDFGMYRNKPSKVRLNSVAANDIPTDILKSVNELNNEKEIAEINAEINGIITSLENLDEKDADTINEYKNDLARQAILYRQITGENFKMNSASDSVNKIIKDLDTDYEIEKITTTDEDGNTTSEYEVYSLQSPIEDKKEAISQHVTASSKAILDKYSRGLQHSFGKIGDRSGYIMSIDDMATAQAKADKISKVLNANVIFDSTIDGKAQLLSALDYRTLNARRLGDNRPIIILNPERLTSDTVYHEFGHLYIELLGENDSKVMEAFQLLAQSDLYKKVAEDYPELSGTALDKEVLATALGMEADRIAPRKLTLTVAISRILNAIIDAIKSIFNIQPDVLTQLAREVTGKDKNRVVKGTIYSSTTGFFSKYKVDPTKTPQSEAERIFNELNENSSLDEDTHEYTVDGQIFKRSITWVAGRLAGKSKVGKDKADFNTEFVREDYDEYTILDQLNGPKIPATLAFALNDFINSRIEGFVPGFNVPAGSNWLDIYLKEISEDQKLTAQELANKKKVYENNPAADISMRTAIKKHINLILDRAERTNKVWQSSSVMGNAVHKGAEAIVKKIADKFPSNIENADELLKTLNDIISRGERNGSKFFSEQLLFDEDTKSPGTADLIEITKDGKFKIYDFKTTKSFKKNNGDDHTPNSLFYAKGYVHQLLSYGEILKKYGIEAAEDPYHIVMASVHSADPDVIVETEDQAIRIGNVRSTSIKNIPGYESKFKQSQKEIERYFKNKKVEAVNLKEDIENLDDATNMMYKAIAKFNKTLRNKSLNLDTTYDFKSLQKFLDENADGEAMKKYAEDVKFKYNKYISASNKVVVNRFIDDIHKMMSELREFHSEGDFQASSAYLQSLNYVIQLADTLVDIKKGLTPAELTKNNTFTEEEAREIEHKLDDTIDAIAKNRTFYKEKLIETAIHALAANSKLYEGVEIEKLEIEARKEKGLIKKEDITRYIQENIKNRKDKLESKELAYWTAQYSNGILDLRMVEAMFADPGMMSSQIVQVVKQMMDSNDLLTRQQMMEYGPDIEKWYNETTRPAGNTRKQWSKFLTKSKVYVYDSGVKESGRQELMEDGGIVPEFISDKYNTEIQFRNFKRDMLAKKRRILEEKTYNTAVMEEIDEIHEKIRATREKIDENYRVLSKIEKENYTKPRVNPAFSALSPKEQADLRYIHKNLRQADDRVELSENKLSYSIGKDVYIYRLPRQRMSIHEAGVGNQAKLFGSRIKDMVRPPADNDQDNTQDLNDELTGRETGIMNSDLKGNQHLDIPVFYRNELEDPRLQSFDIPTLLLENHMTTLNHQQATLLEADLFVIKESISSENNDKIIKTDSFNKKIIKDMGNVFTQKSTDNYLYKALQSSIDQRLYRRSYSGVYSKGNYRLIKGMEALSRFTTINSLTMNFKSALTTSLQGSVFRAVEGFAGEHFNMQDWKKGTSKTYSDIHNMTMDSQRHIPKSKTNLLIKLYGLEQRQSALSNKFVQDNFAKKNLDSASLYAVTSMAENMVSSMLMYSMMSNVKVMDKDQNYIDKDGKIVKEAKDAMTLDEAYTVVDGKLVLHPKVTYTTKNFIDKFAENGNIDKDVATEIVSSMQNVYANMYGQYNEHLKSQIQRNAIGKVVMSMKGWLPRGLHNRFRGITSTIPFFGEALSFEELRDEDNLNKRFFSQSTKTFHEGYHTTSIRFLVSTFKDFSRLGKMNAISDTYAGLTTHERANIKRSLSEAAVILISMVMFKFIAALAKSMDDEDERTSEMLYFTAYMTYRLHDELSTFVNPFALIEMAKNPAASMNSIANIGKLLVRLFGVNYDLEEGLDFNINDTYDKGDKKGDSKLKYDILKLLPGSNNTLQLLQLLGLDVGGKTMEDQYKAQMMIENQ